MKDFASLFDELTEKVNNNCENSRTVKELSSGIHNIGKKIVEEAGEVWIAAEYQSDSELAEEISQLIYHLQVMMIARGLRPEDIQKFL